jgi:hypothetical protein
VLTFRRPTVSTRLMIMHVVCVVVIRLLERDWTGHTFEFLGTQRSRCCHQVYIFRNENIYIIIIFIAVARCEYKYVCTISVTNPMC